MTTATLHTEIEIEATAECIWQILTDFTAYPRWNPFIIWIEGLPIAGTRLKANIKPEGSRGMIFNPTVLQAVPNREFRWLGKLLFPGLMDGEHIFRLEPLGNGRTRFVQEETFRGLLVPLFLRLMTASTLAGFHAMNQALKKRVETQAHSEQSVTTPE